MGSNAAQHKCRCGLTLVELLVVVAIIGLVTTMAATRFSGVTRRAKLGLAIDRLAAADAGLRQHAARHARGGQLRLELGSGRAWRSHDPQGRAATVVDLGAAVEFRRFVSATRDARGGRATVDYSPQGTSETFAVELLGAGDSVWLLFAGVTGQVTRLENQRDVEELLRTIEPDRLDAR